MHNQETTNAVVVIHGGGCSGNKNPSETGYQEVLTHVLQQAYKGLERDESAIEIVTNAVAAMEESGHFIAGKGSSQNHVGQVELDASIMNGADKEAGSVAAVQNVVNPIRLARLVMESSPHLMLAGAGANNFAEEHQVELVENPDDYYSYAYEKIADHTPDPRHGTVGAVALDTEGNLAAATSTGGTVNKQQGRIGDSPLIGAGTWADRNVAVSCTGYGEIFIRCAAAHNVAAQISHNVTLAEAASKAIEEIETLGGFGGLISVDKKGDIAAPYHANKNGSMKYGWIKLSEPEPQIYP